MKKIKGLTVLMGITLLIICGFQLYWLKDNYNREKKSLQIRSSVAFQETVRRLQTVKLKLKDPSLNDSLHKRNVRLIMNDEMHDMHEPDAEISLKGQIIPTVNAMRDKMNDSLRGMTTTSTIRLKKNFSKDSLPITVEKDVQGNKMFFKILYDIDSLQDSLKVPEIADAYRKKTEEEKIAVPFTISRIDSMMDLFSDPSNVTVGFAHPITYHLELGNSFPYLMKRITLPVLFSVFLVGVTILSFLLLYRNLMRQQRLAQLKNEFISNVTHELKTPIATVGVAIEALKNFNALQDPERTKEYLDISANELQRLNLLVDKVLKLSMFENKEVTLKKEKFDMRELLDEVLNIMRLQFEKRQAKVTVETSGDDFIIEADRLHITSVLYNLFDNALKYGKEKPEIGIKLSVTPWDIIELKVKDNGIGIAKEYQLKIFEKFFRVPMGDQHNIKGYGLGLSYVSEIVRQHMGYIAVQSELGKGTTFTVEIPRKEADVIHFDDKRKVFKKVIKL
jgi:two-component system phosphate regulon sensor histidine kinase PhoR